MVKKEIISFNQISILLNLLHDHDFDLDSIIFDSEKGILSMSFFIELPERKEKIRRGLFITEYKLPIVEHVLSIHNAKKYLIEDTEKIRYYPLNSIKYSDQKKAIEFIACIPLKFEIIIDEFKMVLHETENVKSWKNYKTFSFLDQ